MMTTTPTIGHYGKYMNVENIIFMDFHDINSLFQYNLYINRIDKLRPFYICLICVYIDGL